MAMNYGQACLSCGDNRIRLDNIAPDIAMSHLPELTTVVATNRLGAGAFGEVFLAEYSPPEGAPIQVAVKRLQTGSFCAFSTFEREASVMAYLRHPCIVNLLGITKNPLQLVLEYCPYGDLEHILLKYEKTKLNRVHEIKYAGDVLYSFQPGTRVCILSRTESTAEIECGGVRSTVPLAFLADSSDFVPKSDSELPMALRFLIALDVAKAMAHMHSLVPAVLHRDLRSANVFLVSLDMNASVRAKVGDFGLASFATPTADGGVQTWQWMAPEVLAGEAYSKASDVYMFGLLLWELLTRDIPYLEYWKRFSRRNQFQALEARQAIIHDHLRPSLPTLPEQFQDALPLLSNCWHKNPSCRPTFAQILSQLRKQISAVSLMSRTNDGPSLSFSVPALDSSLPYLRESSLISIRDEAVAKANIDLTALLQDDAKPLRFRVKSLVAVPGKQFICTGHNLGYVCIWDVLREELIAVLHPTAAVVLDHRGNHPLTKKFPPQELAANITDDVYTLLATSTGVIVAVTGDGIAILYDIQGVYRKWELLGCISMSKGTTTTAIYKSAALTCNDRLLWAVDTDGRLTLCDLELRSILLSLKLQSPALSVCCTRNEEIWIGENDGIEVVPEDFSKVLVSFSFCKTTPKTYTHTHTHMHTPTSCVGVCM